MPNITVSVDGKGNLQCPDISGYLNESLTWVPDGTTVTSIQSITASVGSFNPAPSSRNGWTGTVASDGSLNGGGLGVAYTIVVNTPSGQKTRTPKITVAPPDEVTAPKEATLGEVKI